MKLSEAKQAKRRGERGSVLVISAVGMLALLVGTGLCVDISHFYLVKTELQNAADAAALAGASALNDESTGIAKAVNRATAAMNNYEFNKSGVTMTEENVRFAVNLSDFDQPDGGMSASSAMSSPSNVRFVKVTTPEVPVNVFFASVIKDFGNSRNLKAAAVAGRSVYINNYCDWLPFTVILDDADTLLKPGSTYTFRAGPGGMVSPGDYQILAAEGAGGQDVETGAGEGVHICKKPGDEYPIDTKPGITAGKVRKGINARFDDYQGSQLDPAFAPPDVNVKENITKAAYDAATVNSPATFQRPSHPGVENRRLVIIPLVRKSEFDQGRNVVRFTRFGLFFLQTKVGSGSGGDFKAEYLEDTFVVGSGGYDPSGPAGNPQMTIPVLYK